MVDPVCILTFPEELLIKIFEFCDVQSLGRLARTCQRFKQIIYTEESCWREKCRNVICSNMISKQMQLRSKPFLSSRQRCEVSRRWEKGLNERRTLVKYSRCVPCLALDQNYLFCSKERVLVQYPRQQDGTVSFTNVIRRTPRIDDVSKFVINGDEIVTASRDGMIVRWTKSDLSRVHSFGSHSGEIHGIDAKHDIIITASRDSLVKIWRAYPDNTRKEKEIFMDGRVLSIAIMPSKSRYVVGLPGTNNKHPLQLFEFEKDVPVLNMGLTYQRGAGILHIYPECDHTFFCYGYESSVKLWDIRSPQQFVASWMDPYDDTVIYCVQSDHNVTIMSGASRSGLIQVWDKRKPGQECLQQYSEYDSPAYSLAFDASHLYGAYDKAVVQYSYLWSF